MSDRVYFDRNHFVNFEMMDNSFKLGFIYGKIYTQEFEDGLKDLIEFLNEIFEEVSLKPTMKILEDICNCYLGTHFLEPCKAINFENNNYVFLEDYETQPFVYVDMDYEKIGVVYFKLDNDSLYQKLLNVVKNDTDKMDIDE